MKVIDLFSGCGGLSLGFQNAGFEILFAVDNWNPAIKTYQMNFKHPIWNVDLKNENFNIIHFDVDVIVGGPPCQDFSIAGKRDEKQGRAELTEKFAKIVCDISPKYFVMENVDMAIKSKTFQIAKNEFERHGYETFCIILNAKFCGCPQSRKRLFLIGSKKMEKKFLQKIFDEKISKEEMTVSKYFGDKINFEYYYRHPRNYNRRGIFSIYESSPAIRSVNRPIPKGYQGHPKDACPLTNAIRPLTYYERAQIQTFPVDFKFFGTKTEIELQIANAVPVKLAQFVANCLLEYHNQIELL